MKLSKVAILAIRGSDVGFRKELAKALGISNQTMYRYLVSNDDSLTKAAALELIRKHTGLTDDQLLDADQITA